MAETTLGPAEIMDTVRTRGFIRNGDVTSEGRAWFKHALGIDLPTGAKLLDIGLHAIAEEVLAGKNSGGAPRTRAAMERR